jgi:hypothetical protein
MNTNNFIKSLKSMNRDKRFAVLGKIISDVLPDSSWEDDGCYQYVLYSGLYGKDNEENLTYSEFERKYGHEPSELED